MIDSRYLGQVRLLLQLLPEVFKEKQFYLKGGTAIKSGEPQWDLLGITMIEKLPALHWKLSNIRKMLPDKHKRAIEKLKAILGM